VHESGGLRALEDWWADGADGAVEEEGIHAPRPCESRDVLRRLRGRRRRSQLQPRNYYTDYTLFRSSYIPDPCLVNPLESRAPVP